MGDEEPQSRIWGIVAMTTTLVFGSKEAQVIREKDVASEFNPYPYQQYDVAEDKKDFVFHLTDFHYSKLRSYLGIEMGLIEAYI